MTEIKKIDCINDCNDQIIFSKENSLDTILRTGDKANVILEFIFRPEYIKVGMRIIFREGKVRAVGKVIELL